MENEPVEGMMEPQPKRRGCLFWGCLVLLIVFLAIGSCIGIVYYRLRDSWTSPEPVPIPRYTLKPGEYEKVEKKLAAFGQAAEEVKPATLELSADELNALIAGKENLKKLNGKVAVKIEGDKVLLDASIPLDEAPLPFLKGRYFNGTLATKLSLKDGSLMLSPESATVKDKAVPKEFLDQIRTMDLLHQGAGGETKLDFLEKVKTVEIRDGKVIVGR